MIQNYFLGQLTCWHVGSLTKGRPLTPSSLVRNVGLPHDNHLFHVCCRRNYLSGPPCPNTNMYEHIHVNHPTCASPPQHCDPFRFPGPSYADTTHHHTHTKATCEALTKGEALTKDSTSPQAHSTSFLFCNCVPNPFCQGIVAANPYFCQGNAFCKNSHPHFLLSRKMGG